MIRTILIILIILIIIIIINSAKPECGPVADFRRPGWGSQRGRSKMSSPDRWRAALRPSRTGSEFGGLVLF